MTDVVDVAVLDWSIFEKVNGHKSHALLLDCTGKLLRP